MKADRKRVTLLYRWKGKQMARTKMAAMPRTTPGAQLAWARRQNTSEMLGTLAFWRDSLPDAQRDKAVLAYAVAALSLSTPEYRIDPATGEILEELPTLTPERQAALEATDAETALAGLATLFRCLWMKGTMGTLSEEEGRQMNAARWALAMISEALDADARPP